jgi:hypothetical protein
MPAVRDDEVTPEMIEAGAQVVWRNFDDLIPFGSETGRWTAVQVFRAMEAARRLQARTDQSAPRQICKVL